METWNYITDCCSIFRIRKKALRWFGLPQNGPKSIWRACGVFPKLIPVVTLRPLQYLPFWSTPLWWSNEPWVVLTSGVSYSVFHENTKLIMSTKMGKRELQQTAGLPNIISHFDATSFNQFYALTIAYIMYICICRLWRNERRRIAYRCWRNDIKCSLARGRDKSQFAGGEDANV